MIHSRNISYATRQRGSVSVGTQSGLPFYPVRRRSMIGGLFAESPNASIEARAKSWFDGMCSLWQKILDLTWSHSAMFTGAGFNRTLQVGGGVTLGAEDVSESNASLDKIVLTVHFSTWTDESIHFIFSSGLYGNIGAIAVRVLTTGGRASTDFIGACERA